MLLPMLSPLASPVPRFPFAYLTINSSLFYNPSLVDFAFERGRSEELSVCTLWHRSRSVPLYLCSVGYVSLYISPHLESRRMMTEFLLSFSLGCSRALAVHVAFVLADILG